jgi:hypothetical protein
LTLDHTPEFTLTGMHLPARTDAPIACDMRSARDTPEERLAEYRELFERALVGRERSSGAVVLRFHAGARGQVEDLARREHACCPFLDYRVEVVRDEVVWTVAGDLRAASTLDAFHALPDIPDLDFSVIRRRAG